MNKLLRSATLFLSLALGGGTTAQQPEAYPKAKLTALEKSIDTILQKTRTPGVAAAIVRPDGTVWTYTSGVRNKETNLPITEATLFRLGSISKMFVAQAVMKLVERGELSLKSDVRTLAPEITFENPWQDTHPIRISHLLEHTTGWDAPHFRELASNNRVPLTLKEALDLHPHSRVSRWVPGSRTAYNNTGPLVAAYIVEKVSGLSFETFVSETFLNPLGMENTGYFFDENYRNKNASNYKGRTAQPYWHLANRAAGGLHSSLEDMIKYARFMLKRGKSNDVEILSEGSLATTENPFDAFSAQKGMQLNFGLGNINIHHNGFIYNGHEGSLMGSNALFAYQKDLQVAHIVLTNGETPASAMIHYLIADLETLGKQPPIVQTNMPVKQKDFSLSGFYRAINPVRTEMSILQSILPWRLTVTDEGVTIAPLLGGAPRHLLSAGSGKFLQNTTGRVALLHGVDPLAGDVLYYGPQTLKKISGITAVTPLLMFGLWIFTAVSAVIFALIWAPRLALKKLKRGPQISVRLWPLLSVGSAFVVLLSMLLISQSLFPYALAGNITAASLAVFLGSLAFVLTSGWSIYNNWRLRRARMNKFMYWHASILSVLNASVSLYLLTHGIIGIRLWA